MNLTKQARRVLEGWLSQLVESVFAVPDPDLEMGAREEEGSSKIIFLGPSGLQFGLKIKGVGGNSPIIMDS